MSISPVLSGLRDGAEIMGGTESGRHFVMLHGRPFTPSLLPKGMRKRKPRSCYESCAKMALDPKWRNAGFHYAEGFAMRPSVGILMGHAWLTREEEAFDPTWRDMSGRENLDCHYYGVTFTAAAVGRLLVDRGYYGLLDPADRAVEMALAA